MTGSYIFTSERLGFRNWTAADLQAMAAINDDPEVMKYFPSRQTIEETAGFLQRMQRMYVEKGFCYFAAEALDQGLFIGFIGLAIQNYEAPFTPCVDIGWRLAVAAWGKGYATEGARRCLEYAFNTLKLDSIKATAPLINIPSIRVMEKAGMKPLLHFEHPALLGWPELVHCACYEIRDPEA